MLERYVNTYLSIKNYKVKFVVGSQVFMVVNVSYEVSLITSHSLQVVCTVGEEHTAAIFALKTDVGSSSYS